MKWRPLRIWDWRLKLLYAVAAYVVPFLLVRAFLLGVPDPGFLATACDITVVLLGARIFRGTGEDVDPPRAHWRMTSRPTLSRRLGKVLLVCAIILAIDAIVVPFVPAHHRFDGRPEPVVTVAQWIGTALFTGEIALFAVLYLRSARRLGWRSPKPASTAKPLPGLR